MFPRNSLLLLVASAAGLLAQGPDVPLDPRSSFKVNLPGEGPLSLVSADWGQSRATARGGAVKPAACSAASAGRWWWICT